MEDASNKLGNDRLRLTSSVNSLQPISSLSSSVSLANDCGKVFKWFSLNSSVFSCDNLRKYNCFTAAQHKAMIDGTII